MPSALPYSFLWKMTLWYVLLVTGIPIVVANDFGIPRRIPAAPQPSQQILPYVIRLIAFDNNGQSFGTGSYVGTHGGYGIILTNWHVIMETPEEARLVHVHFPSGFSSFGAIIKSDHKWDLALVAISKPPQSIPTLAISQVVSKPGDPLWIAGFGSGTYRIAEGRCVRYLAPGKPDDGTAPLYEILEVSVSARKGDSGGPILNQKGELAGVLFGSDMIRNTAGSFCERVSRFLMETQGRMADLPSRPEAYFASKEENGPRHSLRDSRNAVPRTTSHSTAVPQRFDSTDSSGTSVDVRSSSQHYVQPVSNELPRIQPQVPKRGQESPATMGLPLTSQIPTQEIEPEKIVQTAHLVSLGTGNMPKVVPAATRSCMPDRYKLKWTTD